MIALKKLVMFLNEALEAGDSIDKKTLRQLVNESLAYLNRTKTLEYSGPFKLPGVAFKLIDLNIDLDDAVKAILDKRSDIEFTGELLLIIEEAKKDEK